MKIYVMGTYLDVNVSSVCEHLDRLGVETEILECLTFDDVSNYPELISEAPIRFGALPFCINMDRQSDVTLEIRGRPLAAKFLFWDKVKLMDPHRPLGFSGSRSAAWYRTSEWLGFYDVIRDLYPGRIVNPPAASRRRFKPAQQALASMVGLKVPRSLVSTDRQAILKFSDGLQSSGGIVAKTLAESVVQSDDDGKAGYSMLTTPINHSDIREANDDQFLACPHFFQELIKKKYELRVVYVNGWMQAFRIDSQAFRSAEVDWRYASTLLAFDPVPLEGKLSEQIASFMRLGSYFSGSIDLIVDPDDQVFFLECNHDGSWAFLDNFFNGQIARKFAEMLKLQLLEKNCG